MQITHDIIDYTRESNRPNRKLAPGTIVTINERKSCIQLNVQISGVFEGPREVQATMLGLTGLSERWVTCDIVYGRIVYKHLTYPRSAMSEWRGYKVNSVPTEDFTPVLLALHASAGVVAGAIWMGDDVYDYTSFLEEIDKIFDRPVEVQERVIQHGRTVTVLIAAPPTTMRDTLINEAFSYDGVEVRTASTFNELMDKLDGIDVIVIADELARQDGAKPEKTYFLSPMSYVLQELRVPVVGWALSEHRKHMMCIPSHLDNLQHQISSTYGHVLYSTIRPDQLPMSCALDAIEEYENHP